MLWEEVVKLFNLYNNDVLRRGDIILLLKDLLCDKIDIFQDLKKFTEFEDSTVFDSRQSSMGWGDIDFRQCKRFGPSYRSYPAQVSHTLLVLFTFLLYYLIHYC